MGITQARTWGKTIGSVILILVTMLLAGCSKQTPEAQSAQDNSDSPEVSRLKQQVTQLQSAISEKDKELAKLRQQSAPTSTTDSGNASPGAVEPQPASSSAEPQQPIHFATEQEIAFQLKDCSLSGSLVKCDLLITNKGGEKGLKIHQSDRSRFIDDAGREYPATYFTLGANVDSYSARTTLPGDVPMGGQIQFSGVKPGTKTIQLLEIACVIYGPNDSKDAIVKFSKIDL